MGAGFRPPRRIKGLLPFWSLTGIITDSPSRPPKWQLFSWMCLARFPYRFSGLSGAESVILPGRTERSLFSLRYGTDFKNIPILPVSAIRHNRPVTVSSMNWSLLELDTWPKTNLPFSEDKILLCDGRNCGEPKPNGWAQTVVAPSNTNKDSGITKMTIFVLRTMFLPPLPWMGFVLDSFTFPFP